MALLPGCLGHRHASFPHLVSRSLAYPHFPLPVLMLSKEKYCDVVIHWMPALPALNTDGLCIPKLHPWPVPLHTTMT